MTESCTTRLRLIACYGAIAAAVPYLAFKLAWLAGSDLGTIGQGAIEMTDTKHVVGNVITIGLELAAIVVVLAFTYPWGRRLPAWLVLVPIWIGTGLLAPIALGVPIGFVAQAFAGGSPAAPDNGLREWVYAIIYGGFTLQGVLLIAAFVLYARARWPEIFHLETSNQRPSALLVTAAAIAAGFGVMNVVWAVTRGSYGGYPPAVETLAQQTFWVGQGLLGIAGAIGVLALHRWRGRAFVPLCAAWIGTGVTFASGLYAALVEAGNSPILFLNVLAGLTMAVTIARPGLGNQTKASTGAASV